MKNILLFIFIFINISLSADSWYKSQIGKDPETYGAAVIAMILESKGIYTSTDQILNQLDWDGFGNISYDELIEVLNRYNIEYRYLSSINDWNETGYLMVMFNPRLVSQVEYQASSNSYMLIVDRREDNFVVHDPNATGPGRYYSVEDVFRARMGYILWIY